MGLYAIGATLGRPAWRRTAIARERALALRLIHDDGSDEEGALTYAVNNYRWFRHAAERLRQAGDPVPAELLRTERIPGFIAAATRPDSRVEALGDTSANTAEPQPLARYGGRVRRDRRCQRCPAGRHVRELRRRLRLRPVGLGQRQAAPRRRDVLQRPRRSR